MQKRIRVIYIVIFLCIAFGYLAYERTHKIRIFILHSYGKNMPWVMDLNKGIAIAFKDKNYLDVRYFYMNTKMKTSPVYFKRIAKKALAVIKKFAPDVLIAFDANAQRLVAKKIIDDNSVDVVLAGLTEFKALLKYKNVPNVTGVLERIPVRAIREVLSLVFHHKKRLMVLTGDSTSAKQLNAYLNHAYWGSYQFLGVTYIKTYSQWQQAIKNAQKKADILLIAMYQTIKEGKKNVDTKKLVKWTLKNSKKPVVGIYESFILDGGWLAIAVSGMEQGYTAARLSLMLVEKKVPAVKLPFVESQNIKLYINKEAVKKAYPGAHIPVILEAFSRSQWQLDDWDANKTNSKVSPKQQNDKMYQQLSINGMVAVRNSFYQRLKREATSTASK